MSGPQAPVITFDESDFDEVDEVYGGPAGGRGAVYVVPVATWSCSAGHGWRLLSGHFDEYFINGALRCGICGEACDLPRLLGAPYRQDLFEYHYPLGLAGANFTSFRVELSQDIVRVRLSDFGIPVDALRLEVETTTAVREPLGKDEDPFSAGRYTAIEAAHARPRRYLPDELTVIRHPKGTPPYRQSEVVVNAYWVGRSSLPPLFVTYAEAARLFYELQFAASLLWANTAVEGALAAVLQPRLAAATSNERVKRFLEEAATYSHQLNVLLPFVADSLGWPTLSDDIRGQLNKLRQHRNDVAHGGSGANVPDYSECGRLLVAALTAIHYLRLVGAQA